MSLTVRHKVSLYIICSMWPHYSPSTHPDVLGTWAMAPHTPCKPCRSWQSLSACPYAPPRHRSLKHTQTCTHMHIDTDTQTKHVNIHAQKRGYLYARTLRFVHLQVLVRTHIFGQHSLTDTPTHTYCMYVDMHTSFRHLARPSCHWKIVLHSTEGVMGCYQQDHSMDGCPNWE